MIKHASRATTATEEGVSVVSVYRSRTGWGLDLVQLMVPYLGHDFHMRKGGQNDENNTESFICFFTEFKPDVFRTMTKPLKNSRNSSGQFASQFVNKHQVNSNRVRVGMLDEKTSEAFLVVNRLSDWPGLICVGDTSQFSELIF